MPEIFYDGCLCPVCEAGSLKLASRTEEFVYKGNKVVLTREVWECAECQEFFFQRKDKPEIQQILADRRRRVDGLLMSSEIQAIRVQLHLTPAALADLLRIPEQALCAYETGQSTQNYELDDVLRILQVYPETITVFEPQKPAPRTQPRPKRKPAALRSRLVREKMPQPVEA